MKIFYETEPGSLYPTRYYLVEGVKHYLDDENVDQEIDECSSTIIEDEFGFIYEVSPDGWVYEVI